MVRVYESNIIFLCVRRPSIIPLRCLLVNHWAEFNQSCYITSPYGKSVQEQHYFSVRPSVHMSVVRPSVPHAMPFQTTGRISTKFAT